MKEQIVLPGKEYEEYYKRVVKAWQNLIKTTQKAPKHVRVHIELLREHDTELKRDLDISIKYPLVGDSGNFREIRDSGPKLADRETRLKRLQKLIESE